jgi:protein ImuB
MQDLCAQMNVKGCGLREGVLQAFRLDGRAERLNIGTGNPSRNPKHLFKLFEEKLPRLDPGPGIETFILCAPKTELVTPAQNGMGMDADNYFHDDNLPELIDRLAGRLGMERIYGIAPRDSHWPERAVRATGVLDHKPGAWTADRERPVMLLARPEPIDVMAPVPDDPPMLFRRKGALHRIRYSEGPERIEAEWWLRSGDLRDYYRLEDDDGNRYWVFRSGHYRPEEKSKWFLHGFFA